MILNVSGRTDIVAFYTEWFMNRYKEGFLDVRNPFYEKNVSRIYFDDVDAIVFCTKNPLPIIKYLKDIDKKIYFFITLTPYHKDIEPNVPPKGKIIEAIKEISKIIGKENTVVRYDPILINDKYTIDYHIKAFSKMCLLLDGFISSIVVSFIDDYKNVQNNKKVLNNKELTEDDYKNIGLNFASIAKEHHMTVQTCCEEKNLAEFGFIKRDCVDLNLAYKLTGKTNLKKWKARNNKFCNCVSMVDIGEYNTCSHFCKYCYANFDEKKVLKNKSLHNPNSSLLIGELKISDVIKTKK